ncbi:uncharacterized protein LOC130636842 [Hydractinia symbiolongicarpus]|uniref:uncharacterized protein LOC130636842 n=1 Tax=Hydractinia symbiolongicarpus TaxID=13093 RepID=UPI00254E18DA|nr:uncharacterized protein LOC130636842 [Hydractinia symbiolongicarpus]
MSSGESVSRGQKRRREDRSAQESLSLSSIKNYFDKKFEDIQTKFEKDNHKLAKKFKKEPELSFKFKGNKKQYEFNESIRRDLETLGDLIRQGSKHRSTKMLQEIGGVPSTNTSQMTWLATPQTSEKLKLLKIVPSEKSKTHLIAPENQSFRMYRQQSPKLQIKSSFGMLNQTSDELFTPVRLASSQQELASAAEKTDTGENTAPKLKDKSTFKDKLIFPLISSKTCKSKSNNKFESVKGNLKNKIPFWESIKANRTIIDILKHGYKIPFFSTPEKAHFENNRSALMEKEFVTASIKELLESGRIRETAFTPHVVNPLSVSTQGNGKKRLILDLRHVNKHIYKDKVKFDDWRVMEDT